MGNLSIVLICVVLSVWNWREIIVGLLKSKRRAWGHACPIDLSLAQSVPDWAGGKVPCPGVLFWGTGANMASCFFQFRTQDLQVTSPVFIQPLTRGYNFYLAHTLLCATFFFGNTFCHPSLDLGFCQERQQTFFLCWRNALYHCAVIEKFFFNIYCNNNADYQSLYQVMAYLHIKQW